MDPQPPAWRVFETPASSQGDGLPATTGDVHPKAGLSALGAGAPMWLGLAAALVIGVAAIAVAVGGLGGGTVEGLGPIGSSLASDASQLGELIVDVA